ncbi:DUF1189 family protein [Halobacillus andaensis]|uniref:DUF1189 family protein n=1 Tax=Halobacillus andaensis TaxID=1176239 RepID=UPI00166ABCF1|nr:DUF1189 family protein [Halobacillus andaensis]MBP2003077.1 O-antigen/teichoic acid export membrane protein [Halobacillus andaensis]
MSKTQQLIKSFYHSKMLAAFRIQPMGKAISYLFFLSVVILIPVLLGSLFTYFFTEEEFTAASGVSSGIFIVIFLPFLYFFIAAALFCLVSILASMALLYTRIRSLRTDYKQLWNITAFSITAPTIVFVLLEIFIFSSSWLIILHLFFSLIYIGLALQHLPTKNRPA